MSGQFYAALGQNAGDIDPTPMMPQTWDAFVTDMLLRHYGRVAGKLKLAEYNRLREGTDEEKELAKSDKNGAYYMCARLNGTRCKANVQDSAAVLLDLDAGMVDLPDIHHALGAYTWWSETSYSHSPACPKWHVVVPLDRPATHAEYAATWDELAAKFPAGAIDKNTKNIDRLFFAPGKVCADQLEHARAAANEGQRYRVVTPPSQPAVPASRPLEWTSAPIWGVPGTDDDMELVKRACRRKSGRAIFGDAASFEDLWTAAHDKLSAAFPGANWYDPSAAEQGLANRLIWWTGGDCERTARLMRQSALTREKMDRADYMERTILKALALVAKNPPKDRGTPPTPTDADPRIVIELNGGEFHVYTAICEGLLAGSVYVQGSNLVRIGSAGEITDPSRTTRAETQVVCMIASPGWIRRVLMHRARFVKFDKRAQEWEPRDCPREIAENIREQQSWPALRPLTAISTVPVLRPDMSLWTQPGYDAMTGVYHHPTLCMPPIPERPTRDDALAALARLREPFDQFPYASAAAESVFLAHVLTAVVRTSFDTSPVFVYTAPMPATGKTLLASMPNLIAQGVTPAHSPWSEGEELRKVLFASLLSGDTALTIDNVPNGQKIRAPGLCNFSTSGVVADRVLGRSERQSLPNRCTVVFNGNNITPVGDLARRSLVSRLDVNAETARGRSFRIHDLRAHVLEHRAQLITDVLTIVRAYHFSDRTTVARPLESFEKWSRIVRDPLAWLGMVDPVASQDTETDDEIAPLRGAFEALAAVTQGNEFTSAHAAAQMGFKPQLRAALVNAGCTEPADAKKLGYWLREFKDRVASGWKLERRGDAHGSVTNWRLKAV